THGPHATRARRIGGPRAARAGARARRVTGAHGADLRPGHRSLPSPLVTAGADFPNRHARCCATSGVMQPISPSAYWDDIAESWAARPRQRLWRRYSDVLNSRFISEWLPSTTVRRILKTDAFDEANGELGRFLIHATGGASLVTLDVSTTTLQQA